MTERPVLTTTAGAPVASNQNALTVGPRGPVLLEDYQLFEKLAHQNRERVAERVVHAKGWGAHGTLTVTEDITRYSCAKVFAQVGKQVEMLARFSTVAGERGAADAERDVRGFSQKFYTEQGNWDLVGNNTPVFFVADPYKFPDFIHTQKRHPRSNLRSATAMWDFWFLCSESLHQVTILMSDRGIPVDPSRMNGYGSHTYSTWNDRGERFWVKFHFKTRQGHAHLTNDDAAGVIAKTRESYQEALFGMIEAGRFPQWDFFIQVMPDAEAEGFEARTGWSAFDLTKVWPHGMYPLVKVGHTELNRNPDNYFAEVEQAAFNPSNVVPGIGFSPDRMLQGRLFSYPDAHRYRIGVHYEALDVNKPRCPVNNYNLDGSMPFGPRGNPDAFYEPNSFNGPVEDPSVQEPPHHYTGEVGRYDYRGTADHYSQPRALFKLFDDGQRQRLFDNTAAAMQGVPQFIVERQLEHFDKADPGYGRGVRDALERQSGTTGCASVAGGHAATAG